MDNKKNEVFFETKKLTKKFGEVVAVNQVDMVIRLEDWDKDKEYDWRERLGQIHHIFHDQCHTYGHGRRDALVWQAL